MRRRVIYVHPDTDKVAREKAAELDVPVSNVYEADFRRANRQKFAGATPAK